MFNKYILIYIIYFASMYIYKMHFVSGNIKDT